MWQTFSNKPKITQMFRLLISEKSEVKVLMEGEDADFTTRIIAITQDDPTSQIGKQPVIIIEKLMPDSGNSLIQSATGINLEFQIKEKTIRSALTYNGINSTPPYYGFILKLPESIEIMNQRREERSFLSASDLISTEFEITHGKKVKKYKLNVSDYSQHGLGLIIDEKSVDLIDILQKGNRIKNITFFAKWAMIKLDGIVSHITKAENGEKKGSYTLGIESKEIIA